MTDTQRTKTIALIAGGVAVALLLGGLIGWFARGNDRTPKTEAETQESQTATETAETTESVDATEQVVTEEPPTTEAQPNAPEQSNGPTERQPGLVVGTTTVDGQYVLKIDYVQFLTGGAAADAAAAHGDESPPPNDYYVVNDNPKIRQFKIKNGISVFVVTNADGTSDAQGHTIGLDQWIAALSGPNGDAFKSAIYWVTVTDGTITAIEAQYVP